MSYRVVSCRAARQERVKRAVVEVGVDRSRVGRLVWLQIFDTLGWVDGRLTHRQTSELCCCGMFAVTL